jgi:5-methylcytosine-specific restriction protein A
MPSYPCPHPTCTAFVARRGDGCPRHQTEARKVRGERHAYYDQHARDKAAKAFYASAEWQRVRLEVLSAEPVCSRCGVEWANTVHHIKPLAECSPAERVEPRNLQPVCGPCHSEIEREVAARVR